MVIITFTDEQTETKARGFPLDRFSGKVLNSGEPIFPEAAMLALAEANSPFSVHGTTREFPSAKEFQETRMRAFKIPRKSEFETV